MVVCHSSPLFLFEPVRVVLRNRTHLIGDKVYPIFGKMNPGEKMVELVLDSWGLCLFLLRMKQVVRELEKLGASWRGKIR